MSILSIQNLQFSYKKGTPVIKDLNLQVPEGSIYGFLGANGAGKSTTIRSILGLLKPTSGVIQLFNQELDEIRPAVFSRIGALIESPSLYPHLNAIDNLKITCQYRSLSYQNIAATLKKVGLWDNRKKAAGKYSTGMKQRLGLAMALIHDPELLLLDEPTNGLDPNGINEIRQVILQLQEEGKTIFLSSHLLSEIERIATQVGILKNGKLLFEGSLDQLENFKAGTQKIEIKTDNSLRANNLLKPYHTEIISNELLQISVENKETISKIIKHLVDHQVPLYEVQVLKSDLEKMFISLTNN